MRRQSGFTMLEMMVAVAISLAVGATAIPAAYEFYSVFDRRNAEMNLLEDLRLAQATAVEQGCHGIFSVASDRKSYSFGCDYVPYSSASPPPADSQIFVRYLPANIRISTNAEIIYNSRGQAIDEQSFLTSRTVSLSVVSGSTEDIFNTGTLTAIGFFSFAH